MSRYIDMTNWIMSEHGVEDSHIKVLAISEDENYHKKRSCKYWNCECLICGKIFVARSDRIRKGEVKNCGCQTKRVRDISGQTFGLLTALENTNKKGKDGTYIWKCKCQCGNIIETSRTNLTRGDVKSCGCLTNKDARKHMIGKTFGYLTVISENEKRTGVNNRYTYHCQCKCGNFCDVEGTNLRNGTTKSCGCLKRETTSNLNKKDLLNQIFGLLTVKELLPYPNNDGRRLWRCKCQCGNEKIVSSHNLLAGKAISCGCSRASGGELNIKHILEANNYNFIYDRIYFNDLIGVGEGKLRYDFIILNDNNNVTKIIEYDGKQHFQPVDYFGGEEKFKEQKENDRIKNEYAWSHNIPIVRIPYTEKNITLETIMGDQYLVRPPQKSENEN